MIPTKTRFQYASGYLELGMINEVSEEIECIVGEDRMSISVMSFRMKMYRQAEYWPALEAVSKHIAKMAPRKPDGVVASNLTLFDTPVAGDGSIHTNTG